MYKFISLSSDKHTWNQRWKSIKKSNVKSCNIKKQKINWWNVITEANCIFKALKLLINYHQKVFQFKKFARRHNLKSCLLWRSKYEIVVTVKIYFSQKIILQYMPSFKQCQRKKNVVKVTRTGNTMFYTKKSNDRSSCDTKCNF